MLGLTKAQSQSQSHDVQHSRTSQTTAAPANGGTDLRIAPLRLPMSAQTTQGAPSPVEPNTLLAPFDSIAPGLTIAFPDPGASTTYQPPSKLPTLQELISAARRHPSQDEHTIGQASIPGSNWNGVSDDEGASKNPMKELPLGYWMDDIVSPELSSQGELIPSAVKSFEKEFSLNESENLQSTSFSSEPSSSAEGYNEMRRFLSLEEIAPPYKPTGLESPVHYDDSFASESSVQQHLQLPVPKTQQETQLKHPTFGPLAILNGLHEPPPDAGLFPPIDSHSTIDILSALRDDNDNSALDTEIDGFEHVAESPTHVRQERSGKLDEIIDTPTPTTACSNEPSQTPLGNPTENEREGVTTHNEAAVVMGSSDPQVNTAKTGARTIKRKWTDEETNDLLRGVVRCGVGNWKTILMQSDLNFAGRTALNLKDRFRVCCPWVYGGQSAKMSRHIKRKIQEIVTTTVEGGEAAASVPEGNLSKKAKLALMALGVEDPTTALRTTRRARRHFTTEEDNALLRGYRQYGFRWAMIRNDKELNLQHRKPSDLRDRFRTKYPDVYRKGSGPVGPDRDDAAAALMVVADTHSSSSTSHVSEAVNLFTVSPTGSSPSQELSSSTSSSSSSSSSLSLSPPCQLTGDGNATAAVAAECLPPISSLPFDEAGLGTLLSSHLAGAGPTAAAGVADSQLPVIPSLFIPVDDHSQTMEWTI